MPLPCGILLKEECIFITGATGFLGLALVEKILRDTACPRLILLVRGGQRRFWKVYDDILPPRYDRDRITVLDGDLESPHLGLDSDALKLIKTTATIFVHAASSINLRLSLALIYKSVLEPSLALADIALDSFSLKHFIYISTAYSNAHLHNTSNDIDTHVEEKIYSLRSAGTDSTLLEYEDLCCSGFTPEFMSHNFPFPYAYSKHLTERMLIQRFTANDVHRKLLILRPSIVGPALKDPFPGYVIRGSAPATAFLAVLVSTTSYRMAFATRLPDPLRQSNLDEIPVDLVVNRIIMHAKRRTWGVAHAVAGKRGRHVFRDLWQKSMSERRLPWQPRLVWKYVDWHDPTLHPLPRRFVVMGTSFDFEDEKVKALWEDMTTGEKIAFPVCLQESRDYHDWSIRTPGVREQLDFYFRKRVCQGHSLNYCVRRLL